MENENAYTRRKSLKTISTSKVVSHSFITTVLEHIVHELKKYKRLFPGITLLLR